MGRKREALCENYSTCTIEHDDAGLKKKHDLEYHSLNPAIGSRDGYCSVKIIRDLTKRPQYYYCTGSGCTMKTNRRTSMKDHILRCKYIRWTVDPSTTASTLASPLSVPNASQPPSNSRRLTRTTKRKATEMATSAPTSALPPADADISTSLLRSVSPAAPQTSVFQSLATQLELYMKSTDSALFNSQTALEQSHNALKQSTLALQQITNSIATLEEKVDDFLTTTTAYRADINAKWEDLTDRLALQAKQQLAIQDAVGRVSVGSSHAIANVLKDIKMELAKKDDDAIARKNDVLEAISQQRADSQETTRRLEGMSLAGVPISFHFSEFGKWNVLGCYWCRCRTSFSPLLHPFFYVNIIVF